MLHQSAVVHFQEKETVVLGVLILFDQMDKEQSLRKEMKMRMKRNEYKIQ